MTGPTAPAETEPTTAAGRLLLHYDDQPTTTVLGSLGRDNLRVAIRAIEQEAAGDRDALAARVQVLETAEGMPSELPFLLGRAYRRGTERWGRSITDDEERRVGEYLAAQVKHVLPAPEDDDARR